MDEATKHQLIVSSQSIYEFHFKFSCCNPIKKFDIPLGNVCRMNRYFVYLFVFHILIFFRFNSMLSPVWACTEPCVWADSAHTVATHHVRAYGIDFGNRHHLQHPLKNGVRYIPLSLRPPYRGWHLVRVSCEWITYSQLRMTFDFHSFKYFFCAFAPFHDCIDAKVFFPLSICSMFHNSLQTHSSSSRCVDSFMFSYKLFFFIYFIFFMWNRFFPSWCEIKCNE